MSDVRNAVTFFTAHFNSYLKYAEVSFCHRKAVGLAVKSAPHFFDVILIRIAVKLCGDTEIKYCRRLCIFRSMIFICLINFGSGAVLGVGKTVVSRRTYFQLFSAEKFGLNRRIWIGLACYFLYLSLDLKHSVMTFPISSSETSEGKGIMLSL